MMKMSGQQDDYSGRCPNLMVTVQCEAEDRSVAESHSNNRTRRSKDNSRPSSFQSRNVYYNSNHRHQTSSQQQQHFTRALPTPPRHHQAQYYHSYDHLFHHYQQQPIRPLMEIEDNLLSLHHDFEQENRETASVYSEFRQREPKQRGQYRNRKAELDWDHAFDLDLVDLYKTSIDADSRSLTSTISSSDHSFSSI